MVMNDVLQCNVGSICTSLYYYNTDKWEYKISLKN